MAQDSKIEWTHHTFNPWEGCAKVSPGCKNCYADARHERYHGQALGELACWGINAPRMTRSDNAWKQPLKWNRAAQKEGIRKRVFCASLADVFEAQSEASLAFAGQKQATTTKDGQPGLTYTFADIEAERQKLWKLIAATPWLDWLLLTKRPENVLRMVPPNWLWQGDFETMWPSNVWIGTSVENQAQADIRIVDIRKIAAHCPTVFLSMEPLLGAVDVIPLFWETTDDAHAGFSGIVLPTVSWVIVGGESGPNARRMHIGWVRDIRDKCEAAGVPFHFKQWGEYGPFSNHPELIGECPPDMPMHLGKQRTGRTLDGVIHDEFPNA